jgi:predicted RecB family nuclease
MRLTASDIVSLYRPTPCSNRVVLRQRGEQEAEPSAFEQVLRRLGIQHEQEHLATLGAYVDLSGLTFDVRVQKTLEAITNRVAVIYQPAFQVSTTISGTIVEIVGMPDFLIFDGDGYVIRDSKMSRRIDKDNHPEILLQVGLYGWLFTIACGSRPKAIQVHSGTNEIIDVHYDGGTSALTMLTKILELKQLEQEQYEPVGWSKCGGCGFNERCWAQAEAASDVALIPDVDQSLAKALHEINVCKRKELLAQFNVASLSDFKRTVGTRKQKVGKKAERILLFADAMEKRQEKILTVPAIPPSPNYVMFDLEGMPPQWDELDRIYLWGMQVYGANPTDFMPAVAGFGENGDKQGWLDFLGKAEQIFQQYGDIRFVHWAAYEKAAIDRYIGRYGDVNGIAARVKANLLDLLPIARDSVVLPIPSFSLKVIEKYVGFKRTQSEYGGEWSMAVFIEATETSDQAKRQELMNEILKYNEEDLAATWAVFRWLKSKRPQTT